MAGKRAPPRRADSFIQKAFLNKASEHLTVHYSGLHVMPSGDSGLLKESTLKYLLSLLM